MIADVHMVDPKLAAKLINAKSIEEVKEAIAGLERSLKTPSWRPVGGIEANDGPIELGKDAPAQLVERVVNGIEACFELKAHKSDAVPTSPQEAAQTWYPVLKKGLAAASKTDLRKLAIESVRVHLAESGNEKPTVIIEDWGIGQHPSNIGTSRCGRC